MVLRGQNLDLGPFRMGEETLSLCEALKST